MAKRDIVVVGASAGGVEVLKQLLGELPRDFDAAVLIVLHTSPSAPSILAKVLQRRCALPVAAAIDGEPIVGGRVYIAPPDRHLVVEPGQVRVTRAPRENHCRPAVDPLFRSAALAYGPRTIGVVLTGRLDDGTSGLWAVKDAGGTAVVQDPEDADHPDMPRNALEYVEPDHVVPASEIASLLTRLVAEPAAAGVPTPRPTSSTLELEVKVAMEANALDAGVLSLGPGTPFTCPECHGVLARVGDEGIPRFRCHTGHAFAIDSLLGALTESVEDTLWSAVRAIEESVLLLRLAADHTRTSQGDTTTASRLDALSREAQANGEVVRQLVLRHRPVTLATVRSEARTDDLSRRPLGAGAPAADS